MIGQCWIAALRPMRKFGLESGPAKCLSLALVYFIEAKFDVILMFERWEARWQLETLVGTLVIFLSQKPCPKSSLLHPFAIFFLQRSFALPSELQVHAAAVSSDAYTPKSDVNQLKWLQTKDTWHLGCLGLDQVDSLRSFLRCLLWRLFREADLGWQFGVRSFMFLFSPWSEVRGRCATF